VVTRRKLLRQIPRPAASEDLADTARLSKFVRYVNWNVLLKKQRWKHVLLPLKAAREDPARLG
jgi:hypothetical protein